MVENAKVSIKNLYKVFGANPLEAMTYVTSDEGAEQPNLKQWLLREHGHVLGLNNINTVSYTHLTLPTPPYV